MTKPITVIHTFKNTKVNQLLAFLPFSYELRIKKERPPR